MVRNTGDWIAKKDYNNSPHDEWCDLDYVVGYILHKNYKPKTSIEHLAWVIIMHFEEESEKSKHFRPMYNDNCMINISQLAKFVDASGGLEEFDYE